MVKKISLIGIGGQKCATSWLFKCLSEHPEIYTFSGKETHFFSTSDYQKGLPFYQSLFSGHTNESVVGECSTSYLSSKEAPERIQGMFPGVRLVVIFRNPIDRALSHVKHLQSKGKMSKQGAGIQDISRDFPEIIDNGMYAKHLEQYQKYFDANQTLILWYEDVGKKPQELLEQVYRHIGVSGGFVPKGINVQYNSAKVRSSGVYKKINKRFLRLKKHAVGRVIISTLRAFGFNAYRVHRIISFFSSEKKVGVEISREELYTFYKDDILKLEKFTGKDLTHWKI